MKYSVLEFSQAPSDSPKHSISSGKARILKELGWAVDCGKRLIRITIDRSWSAIKVWLQQSEEQRKANDRKAEFMSDYQRLEKARSRYPNGSEFGFAPWPSKDMRTVG